MGSDALLRAAKRRVSGETGNRTQRQAAPYGVYKTLRRQDAGHSPKLGNGLLAVLTWPRKKWRNGSIWFALILLSRKMATADSYHFAKINWALEHLKNLKLQVSVLARRK